MSAALEAPLVIVVGAGGVGKTTLAAALALESARQGHDTLAMTFDPSRRLKDALGVDPEAATEASVPFDGPGRLGASLLDARQTFDRLVARYAPDEAARQRILTNRFYDHLSGTLSGMLEYMAVERLWEVQSEGVWSRVVLDTPPTRQAIDFLQAPDRIVGFLDSGALRIALKSWFDPEGHLRATAKLGFVGRNVEAFFDRMVGLDLLRDMAEFFQAFAPLFEGFRSRALDVQRLLRSERCRFVLVSGPGPERVADTLYFARKLQEAGLRLGPVVVNRVHPESAHVPEEELDGHRLLTWLGQRDRRGVEELRSLLGGSHPLVDLPLLSEEPTDLASLAALGEAFASRL